MSEVRGIDVSVFNGDIDWDRVKSDGIDFAIIRVGAGQSLDERFEYNISRAIKAGIECGVYLYTYATTPQTARDEAEFAVREIRPYSIRLPVFYDIEDKAQHNLSRTRRTELITAFCEEVERRGYKGGVYSSLNWFENYFDLSEIDRYTYWIAEWDVPRLNFTGKKEFWQYTDDGRVDGIDGAVDRDIWYRNDDSSDDNSDDCKRA